MLLISERKGEAGLKTCPTAQFVTSPDIILNDNEIDAVVIATPVHTHYNFALKALNNDKHVLLRNRWFPDSRSNNAY
ncbi:MAG: Gfo/Idh/MocA family oxidoreductase [Ignavibacteria bacterium]